MLLNVPLGEYAHSHVVPDGPLSDVAIRVATMVGETTDASAFGSVNELSTVLSTAECMSKVESVPRPFAAS